MTETTVPESLIGAAKEAVSDSEWIEVDAGIRAAIAAVLPRHEQMVRERIAEALKRISNDREAAAHECADERYHPLMGESGAYWNAARLIREGKEQDGDDD